MYTRLVLFLLITTCMYSCKRLLNAAVPDLHWAAFDSPEAVPVGSSELRSLEGVYNIRLQDDDYGDAAAVKWSYTVEGTDTIHHLSIFCEEDVRYFICTAKMLHDTLLLNGYWRNVENTKTGKAHLFVQNADSSVRIAGKIGAGDEEPNSDVAFTYSRPLNKNYFEIIAHRGGGRNSDLLPASENSVELIKMASRLGATGIEIDVQLTKDHVPVLYHDQLINDRLTDIAGIRGSLSSYSFHELTEKFKLKRGGNIPRLKDALDTVLLCTGITHVWLDAKKADALPFCRSLQQEYLQLAEKRGRKLEIHIGIPNNDVFDALKQLPDHKSIPTISELSPEKTNEVNAQVWAQGWTKGLQEEDVQHMKAKVRRSFVWTLDVPNLIRHYLYDGSFDGIVTNRPSIAAFYHYAKKEQ